jgi:uncharacterized membrane protein
MMQVSHFSGPLPPPDALLRYDQILPGAANRIVTMAEKQQTHRQALEINTIGEQVRQSGRGQHYALISTPCFIGAALWLGLTSHEVAASVLGGATIIGTAAVFITGKITGKSQQTADLEKKKGPTRRKGSR